LIYGVFKENSLLYAVEINNDKINQALGTYNKPIPADEMYIIKKWYKKSLNTNLS